MLLRTHDADKLLTAREEIKGETSFSVRTQVVSFLSHPAYDHTSTDSCCGEISMVLREVKLAEDTLDGIFRRHSPILRSQDANPLEMLNGPCKLSLELKLRLNSRPACQSRDVLKNTAGDGA